MSMKGQHHTEETKLKISLKAKERYKTITNHPMYGKKHTEEAKEKNRLAHSGKNNSFYGKKRPEHSKFMKKWIMENNPAKRPEVKAKLSERMKGKPSPMKGKKHTEETKGKMSLAKKGLYDMENHPNWKGGISFEPYPPEFKRIREFIRERDGRMCQLCGNPENGIKMCVHHIDYNKENCNPDNLISLCFKDNARVNFNRDFWRDYFNSGGGSHQGKLPDF